MRNTLWIVLLLASGCYDGYYYDDGRGGGLRSFEADTGCALTSSVTLSGSPTTWTDCRLRYDDRSGVYTWQLMTPGTTGTWVGQAPGWFTLSFNLDSPENARLTVSDIAGTDPGFVPVKEVVFSYAPVTDANVGGTGFIDVGANIIFPGGTQSTLDAQLSIEIPGTGTLSGTASAVVGPPTDAGVHDLTTASDLTSID